MTEMTSRKKLLISLFILFHLFCVGIWVLPDPRPWKPRLIALRLPFVRAYLGHAAQLEQSWRLFAPNPFIYNRFISAEVEFQDGSRAMYPFPRVEDMGFVGANLNMRWRDVQFYSMLADENLWADLSRFIARGMNEEGKTPVRVRLFNHEMQIPPPGSPEPVDYAALIRDGSRYLRRQTFEYAVRPEDLR